MPPFIYLNNGGWDVCSSSSLPALKIWKKALKTSIFLLCLLLSFSPQATVCCGRADNILQRACVLHRHQELLSGSLSLKGTSGPCFGDRREKAEAQKQNEVQRREVAHGKPGAAPEPQHWRLLHTRCREAIVNAKWLSSLLLQSPPCLPGVSHSPCRLPPQLPGPFLSFRTISRSPVFSVSLPHSTSKKTHISHWSGVSVGWSIVPCAKRLWVRFLVRAHT